MPEFKRIGRNVTVFPLAKIVGAENIEIGDETVIDDFAFLYGVGRGMRIGRFCHITAHCVVQAGGLLTMGDFSALGQGCIALAATDDYRGEGFIGLQVFGEKYRNLVNADVSIGRHAHIGAGSIILPGVTIGEGCSVGAGSVVTRDLPAWTICVGSPCRPVKDKPREKQLAMETEFLAEYEQRQGRIVVTVMVMAYNQEQFIRQALDGILMQKAPWPFEVIVHDDASTDSTPAIIREYAARFPEIVKPIFQDENQFSKTGIYPTIFVYERARGKYIAECDADDYWTDPLKLARQVEFMEAHPSFSLCHHEYRIEERGRLRVPGKDPRDYTADELVGFRLEGYGIGSCTKLYRNYFSEATRRDFENFVGDYPMNVLLGMHGKAKFIEGIGPSVYHRLNGTNSWCSLPNDVKAEKTREMYWKLYRLVSEKGNPHWTNLRRAFV